eukprot:gene10867-biopygen6858
MILYAGRAGARIRVKLLALDSPLSVPDFTVPQIPAAAPPPPAVAAAPRSPLQRAAAAAPCLGGMVDVSVGDVWRLKEGEMAGDWESWGCLRLSLGYPTTTGYVTDASTARTFK